MTSHLDILTNYAVVSAATACTPAGLFHVRPALLQARPLWAAVRWLGRGRK